MGSIERPPMSRRTELDGYCRVIFRAALSPIGDRDPTSRADRATQSRIRTTQARRRKSPPASDRPTGMEPKASQNRHAIRTPQSRTRLASHDLRAPLRRIGNLATWLGEDLADTLTPSAQQQFSLLTSRVVQMEALLNDLLDYAKLGRIENRALLN